jgi:hypothetical protein
VKRGALPLVPEFLLIGSRGRGIVASAQLAYIRLRERAAEVGPVRVSGELNLDLARPAASVASIC